MLFMSSDTAHDHNLEWAITMLLQYDPEIQQKVISYIDDLYFKAGYTRATFQDASLMESLVEKVFYPSKDADEDEVFSPDFTRSA